jgi:hypothetical protein
MKNFSTGQNPKLNHDPAQNTGQAARSTQSFYYFLGVLRYFAVKISEIFALIKICSGEHEKQSPAL